MRNIASKIEQVLDLTLSINADLAAREAYIKEMEDKLSILNTLKEINHYMGAELELKNILQTITDVVMGVLGVSACSICIKKKDSWDIMERSVLENKIVNSSVIETLEKEIEIHNGEILISNLSDTNFINLVEGSFIALSLVRGNVKYGVITLYYNQADVLDENKLEFFRLLSAQLSIHLENSYLFEKVKLASITDGLTGLSNRLHLNESIHDYGHSDIERVGILMIDIDNFKSVNDTYGHIFGDNVLKALASLLDNIDRKYDTESFRYGGEEFLVLCENIDIEGLSNIAEEIRAGFNSISYNFDNGETAKFSLSIGISKFGDSSKVLDMTDLINLADEALYCSKKSGKNRCTISSGDIQLYTKSMDTINKTIAKSKRTNIAFLLCKGKTEIGDTLEKSLYSSITDNVNSAFRVYDNVFYNSLGEFLAILEDTDEARITKDNIQARLNESSSIILDIHAVTNSTIQSEVASLFHIPKNLIESTLCIE